MMIPEFESETAKDSGIFYKLQKSLPVFGADTGLNRGVEYSTVESPAQLAFPGVLSIDTVNAFIFEGPQVGNQTLTFTETAVGSRVFSDAENEYEIELATDDDASLQLSSTISLKIRHEQLETFAVFQVTASSPDAIAFAETAAPYFVDRPAPSPDDNHDGVIYLRLPGLGTNMGGSVEITARSGGNQISLQWETTASGERHLEPFVLLPVSAPPVSTSFKTLALDQGASTVTFHLVANGVSHEIAEKEHRRPPLLACSFSTYMGLSMTAHLSEIDLLIGRKRNQTWGEWWNNKAPPEPPLGWGNAVKDEQLTMSKFKTIVKNHELFYLFAHGDVSDIVAVQDWGFHGPNLYDPNTKTTETLTPAIVEAANADNPSDYWLVFFNSCAGAESILKAREFSDAFGALNYVSWDMPVIAVNAAEGGKKFFRQLDGEKTVNEAIDTIEGTGENPVTHEPLNKTAHLLAPKHDDSVIIDQNP